MTLQENYKMHEQIGYDAEHKDGELDTLSGLVQDKIITVEEAAKRAGLTEAEFEKFLEEYNKKGA